MHAATKRTPFDDMPNDLGFGNPTIRVRDDEVPQAAHERFAPAVARFEEQCPSCRGSGRFISYAGRDCGPCFKCKGEGKRLFKQSAETRAKARVAAEERKNASINEHQAAFKAEHPDEHAWLLSRDLDFAHSLLDSISKFGSLTDNQLRGLRAWMSRDVERAAAKQAAQSDKSVIRLERLHETMQRHAKFYAGRLTLSRKNADQLIWIKLEGQERVVGKIDNAVLTLWNRPGADLDYVRDMLAEFNADPLAAAKKYGKLSGRCCVCGHDLTNDESIDAGIGPVCAGRI